jgi:16S rRNA (adenine1518-N6/adenine1519-N6)-dimethyltransferase
LSRQRLGQHFLVKGSVLDRIAAAACPERVPLVVEIGPGKGALTERLLERSDRVVAVELDPDLSTLLRQRLPDPRLQIVTGDALQTDLSQWGPAVAAGNLPYYISTAILSRALAPGSLLERGVFLVQKEVADRIAALPGSRDYGALSVEMQFHADVRILFGVRPASFHPPPKVDSALIGFSLRSRAAELGLDSDAGFLSFVRLCFHQKRKTIRNNLAADYEKTVTADWPEASLRAEQLTLEKFAAMYRRLVG